MSVMMHGFAALQAVAGDTVVMKTVPVQHSMIEQVQVVASAIITLALLAFVIVAVPAAWSFRKSYKRVSELLDKIRGDVQPLAHHASAVLANLHELTDAVKRNVEMVTDTVHAGNEKVKDAMDATEQRLRDLNALMDVVQDEAERIFVATAAGVHGVRSGAARFTHSPRDGSRHGGLDLASAEADQAGIEELAEDYETAQEIGDGYDGESQPAADAFIAPRIRPRVSARPRSPGVS